MKIKLLSVLLCCAVYAGPQTEQKACAKQDCAQIIHKKEQEFGIPKDLLSSIATVESGMNIYAINALGRSFKCRSKEEAVRTVQGLQSRNVRNIAVGPMQINITSHRKQFRSLEHMFEPEANITYAAKLLASLHKRFGGWDTAVGYYNASSLQLRRKYQNKVFKKWHSKAQHLKIGTGPGAGVGAKFEPAKSE